MGSLGRVGVRDERSGSPRQAVLDHPRPQPTSFKAEAPRARGGQTYLCNLVPLANDVTEPCKLRASMRVVQPWAAASPTRPNTKSCMPRDDCPRQFNRSPALMCR